GPAPAGAGAGRFGSTTPRPPRSPPCYYLLVAPLYLLPLETAALVWLALMAACFFAAVLLLKRAYPEHPALLAWALPAGVLFLPLLLDLNTCQKATMPLLILTGTFLLLDRGRPFRAGLVFGLLAFKPHLAVVIGLALLLKRQGRFVLGGVLSGLFLAGLSLLLGWDVCRQWLAVSSSTVSGYINLPGYPLERLHSWYGFFKLLLGGPPSAVQGATLAADLATAAVLAVLLRGPLPLGRPAFVLQYSGLVVATVLVSPHLLTYDLTLLLLPLFLLTHLLLVHSPAVAEQRRALLWLLVLLYTVPVVSSELARAVHVQGSVLLLAALLVFLA